MARKSNGSSSDLAAARELSRRLSGEGARREAPTFVPFRLERVLTSSPAPARAAAPEIPAAPASLGAGGRKWEGILRWAREATHSDAAFLMDPQGLLVGLDGEIPLTEVEAIGARMMAALTLVHRMTEPGELPPALTISFDAFQLTGFETRLPDGTALTVGLAGKEPVSRTVCALLEKRLIEALAHP